MLVLSRRENQSILFPNLNIKVVISRVAGRIVRVGIEAPREVRVLRGELADSDMEAEAGGEASTSVGSNTAQAQRRHSIRNRLNNAMLGLQVLQAKIEEGQTDDLDHLIFKMFQTLSEINDSLGARADQEKDLDGPSNEVEPFASESMHALIVDDSPNEASLLAQFLQLKGFTTHHVRNGREAIRWLEENPRPQVVLMDMVMPDMDGPTAVREIRSDPRFDDVPLFGVSGLEPEEVGLPTGAAGVDQWFQKPVNAREIAEQIHRCHRAAPI